MHLQAKPVKENITNLQQVSVPPPQTKADTGHSEATIQQQGAKKESEDQTEQCIQLTWTPPQFLSLGVPTAKFKFFRVIVKKVKK